MSTRQCVRLPWLAMVLAAVLILASSTRAPAVDGKPFLMKVGTGSNLSLLHPATAFDFYTEMLSVSFTPRKTGVCAVTAGFRTILNTGALQIALSTNPQGPAPYPTIQVYDNPGRSVSGAITQAFIVEKNVPITFYMVGRNLGSADVTTENHRIWAICSQEKVPVLP